MLYNKYTLRIRDEEGVMDAVSGIENGKEYWVYSFIVRKHRGRYEVVYNVEPRLVNAVVHEVNGRKVGMAIRKGAGRRFSMFSCYARQVYFADTAEEAQRAYNSLVTRTQRKYDIYDI